MNLHPVRLGAIVLALLPPCAAQAQVEPILTGVGADTVLTFAHASVPGATGIDFRFTGAFSPMYPATESHLVVIDFEWGGSVTGPWTVSPDHLKTVPGGITAFYTTGTFHGPDDAAFVRLHFYAGGLMIASGEFAHTAVVPESASALLLAVGLGALSGWRRWRGA